VACLDTSVLLELAGRSGRAGTTRAIDAVTRLRRHDKSMTTTRFNVAELYAGVADSDDERGEMESIRKILSRIRILDFDDLSARQYARIDNHLSDIGHPIGVMDTLIASVALVHDQRLLTLSVKHFSRIPWLKLESY
jgi:predicted nucleic acid-binding protein